MNAAEQSDPQPQWTAQAFSEPVDASALDVGYEVAFPFLASAATDADAY